MAAWGGVVVVVSVFVFVLVLLRVVLRVLLRDTPASARTWITRLGGRGRSSPLIPGTSLRSLRSSFRILPPCVKLRLPRDTFIR